MKRSRFDFRLDARVPWSMVALCAVLGMVPIVVGWTTYMLSERALDIYGSRKP